MKRIVCCLAGFLLFAFPAAAQGQEAKVVLDTVAVQAEGVYEVDPDLATLEFSITNQEKELKAAYDKATASLRRILELAERNGLKRDEITTGTFSVSPQWDKRKIRAYSVQVRIILRIRDFSRIPPILDDLVKEGVTEFRTLTYSLADEEAARQKAVAEAMRRAVGRATAALEQNKQKLGAVRYVNLDVKQFAGITRWEAIRGYATMEVVVAGALEERVSKAAAEPPPPPFPSVQPEKISVRATVQCVFQIQ